VVRGILPAFRKPAGVNPASASCGAVCLECREARNQFASRDCVAVNFLQDFFGSGFLVITLNRVVPSESQKAGITRTRITPGFLFSEHAKMIDEMIFAARIRS